MYHKDKTKAHKKRKYAQGRFSTETTVGKNQIKKVKVKGGGEKTKLASAEKCNVLLDGKHIVCEIITVTDNPASRDYTRRNIITKGAHLNVKTPAGKEVEVAVTSRPGQVGTVNAVVKSA
ncbi:MAG: 30S ribosomal protein S8e [Candidatus Altiarchaeota archaeon]